MLNFSLSSLFQRHFCHSGNNSGHTHVVPVPSAGIELPGQASERLGKCLLLVWLRLQASVWDPSTLGCPPFMDTFGHNAWGWNGPWIHGGRRHVNTRICDKPFWFCVCIHWLWCSISFLILWHIGYMVIYGHDAQGTRMESKNTKDESTKRLRGFHIYFLCL